MKDVLEEMQMKFQMFFLTISRSMLEFPEPKNKTFTENWVGKQSFFCFDIDNGLKNIFVFQDRKQKLSVKEFRESSQNFTSIRQLIEKMKITLD